MLRFVLLIACSTLAAQQYTISTFAGIGPPWRQPTPVPATQAYIEPIAVTADKAGNVYVTGAYSVYKIDPSGILNRIAGNDPYSKTGNGGSPVNTPVVNPTGLVLDSLGNLYVLDGGAIRKIAPDGTITTVVDTTSNGAPAYGVPALAADPYGNLYYISTQHVVRVSAGGLVTHVTSPAGNVSPPEEGSLAATARIAVDAMAVDARGIFLADHTNRRIWLISPDSRIRTFANTVDPAAPAAKTRPFSFSVASGVAVDGLGSVYILNEFNQIRKVAPDGSVSLLPGFDSVPPPDTCVDDDPITSIAADPMGNVYVIRSRQILRVGADGRTGIVTGGNSLLAANGVPATSTPLLNPWGIAVGPQKNVYLTDAFASTVRRVDSAGIITTIAGNGFVTASCGRRNPDDPVVTPLQLTLDPAGDVFVASSWNRVIKFGVDGSRTVVAGDGYAGPTGTDEFPLTTTLKDPHGVAVDSRGNVYIADTFESRIQMMSPDGVFRTVTGTGEQGYSGDGGDAFVAKLYAPTSVAVDVSGNLYLADTGNQRIRKVASDGTITTVAGGGRIEGDGILATQAVLAYPQGVAVDADGNLYISEVLNPRIRKVAPDGIISTIAGTGVAGYSGDGGPAERAQLNYVFGLAVDAAGNVYVADAGNRVIRVLRPDR
ncbi:MAG TPA: hypothetical protein VKE70_08305 [Candidatus Solibacter sp.]|nr:hypothetical protein [Candidatus Solibacter sp.]